MVAVQAAFVSVGRAARQFGWGVAGYEQCRGESRELGRRLVLVPVRGCSGGRGWEGWRRDAQLRRGRNPGGVGDLLGGTQGRPACRSPTLGSYEGCQAAGSASDSGGERRRSPCGVFRFPRGSLTRSCFLYFLTRPKQRLLPGAFFARGVFASFFRCASGRGMVSLSARQPCTFRASSSYPYADSQSGYIMGYPIPIQAGASGSIYVANFVTGGPVQAFKPRGERAPLHS